MNNKTKMYHECLGCNKKLSKNEDYVRPEQMNDGGGRMVYGRACDWCYNQRRLKTVEEILGGLSRLDKLVEGKKKKN